MKIPEHIEKDNLTVIIPFLNEREEVYNTVRNIRETGGNKINIMLINDASDEDYDYEQVSKAFDTTYARHETRKGVAASRDEAIDCCPTEFFLLLDAHMRFYQNDWVNIIISELLKDARTLLCCQSAVLVKNEDGSEYVDKNRAETYGAYIDFSESAGMQAKWNRFGPEMIADVIDIVCVLGAGYACNRTYWKRLKGLEGLRSYGFDEQLISLKVFMEGGKCRLLRNISAGHLYRTAFPYNNASIDLIYNKFYFAEMFLPTAEKYKIFKAIESERKTEYKDAVSELIKSRDFCQAQREYFNEIFTRPIDRFLELNEVLMKENDEKKS